MQDKIVWTGKSVEKLKSTTLRAMRNWRGPNSEINVHSTTPTACANDIKHIHKHAY